MRDVVILLDGEITVTERLKAQLTNKVVIAADGGIKHAEPLGLLPEVWIGDFDSASSETLRKYAHVVRESFPVDKAKTDGELAIERALTLEPTKLILVGAMGGDRLDHMLCHIQQAFLLAQRGVTIQLLSGSMEAYPLLPGEHYFKFPIDSQFSLVPYSAIEGLTIKGAKWELTDYAVPLGSSLTLSNKVVGGLTVSFLSGYQLLMVYLT